MLFHLLSLGLEMPSLLVDLTNPSWLSKLSYDEKPLLSQQHPNPTLNKSNLSSLSPTPLI